VTSPPGFDAEIAAIARRQHGLVTARQLDAIGVSTASIVRRVRARRLHRVHRGIYAVGHSAMTQEMRWMAATLAVGEGAALSHAAAAALHGILRGPTPSQIDIVVGRRHHGIPRIHVHQSRFLEPWDITLRRGVPVTSVPRTLLDLGDVLDPYQLAHVIHEAAFRRKLNEKAVRAILARARGRQAVTVLAGAMDLHHTGSAGTRSDLEDRFRRALLRHRVPAPQVNTQVETARRPLEVDFWWPDLRLCVEVDGSGHDRPTTQAEDRCRDADLANVGIEVIRCRPGEFEHVARLMSERARAGSSAG